jgi:PKD repeat protein
VAWDAVSGATGYRVYYGTTSGSYSAPVDAGSQTSRTVQGLTDGGTYYFAVQAYNGTSTSNYSNEVSGKVPVPAPVASFTASPTSGTAPLLVTFKDASTGSIKEWSWNLGDGTTATGATVVDNYATPGTYNVKLTVTGDGGVATATGTISVTAPPTSSTGTSGGSTTGTGGTTTGGTGTTTGGTTTGGTTTSGTTNTSGTTTTSPGVSGLVAAYGFEESSGRSVIDASGSGNTGTTLNTTRINTNQFGKALAFNGTSAWVTVNDSDSIDLKTAMTLSAWVYPTVARSDYRALLMKEASGFATYHLYSSSPDGRPSTVVNVSGAEKQLIAGPQLPVNTWSHLAATYNGSVLAMYVDGKLVGTRPYTGLIDVSTGPLRIGGDAIWGEYFTGYIDEVRVYNRALAAEEIVSDSQRAVVNLMMSTTAKRSSASPLVGQSVTGMIYVFYRHISPTATSNPVKEVRFWLDDRNPASPSGAPRIIERVSPYDLAGTLSDGTAGALDTAKLSKGVHTVTAQVTLSNGTVLPVMTGKFNVQ